MSKILSLQVVKFPIWLFQNNKMGHRINKWLFQNNKTGQRINKWWPHFNKMGTPENTKCISYFVFVFPICIWCLYLIFVFVICIRYLWLQKLGIHIDLLQWQSCGCGQLKLGFCQNSCCNSQHRLSLNICVFINMFKNIYQGSFYC